MRCLVIHAHPLDQSLTRHFCDTARSALERTGHTVEFLDLYQAGFDPRLTAAERERHHAPDHVRPEVAHETQSLAAADVVVLVFPTWWFGLPAILKGWIDRVFAPRIAFDHDPDFGPIKPLLKGLKHALVITTLGSPWWVDLFILRRPVRRQLKSAVFGACAPQARFRFMPFYASEAPSAARVDAFARKIAAYCATLG